MPMSKLSWRSFAKKKTTDIDELGIEQSHSAIYEQLNEEIDLMRYYSARGHSMREAIFNAECEWDVDTDPFIPQQIINLANFF